MRFEIPWKKIIYHWVLPTLLFMGLFFVVGFIREFHIPRFKTWLLLEVEKQSTEKLPIRIFPKSVRIMGWPLGLEFKDVRLLPQRELSQTVSPSTVERASVTLSLSSLLRGRLRVGEIRLVNGDVKAIINDTPSGKPIDWNKLPTLEMLYDLPIENIAIENLNVTGRLSHSGLAFQLNNFSFKFENSYRALLFEVQSPSLKLKETGTAPTFDLSVEGQALLRDTRFQISGLKIKNRESYLVASGSAYGDMRKWDVDQIDFKTRTNLLLSEMTETYRLLTKEKNLPNLRGIATVDIQVTQEMKKNPDIEVTLQTQGLKYEKYDFGEIRSKAKIYSEKTDFSSIAINHPAGLIKASDFSIPFGYEFAKTQAIPQNLSINSTITTINVSLPRVLKSLGLSDVPLTVDIDATAPCLFKIKPVFGIGCSGDVSLSKMHVWSENKKAKTKNTIAAVDQARLLGKVQVDSEKVTYQTDLTIGPSKGKSTGTINYNTGFNIEYEGKIENLQREIKSLADLKIEGALEIKGNTKGDSNYGTIDAQISGTDLWFEDYLLGKTSGNISYKSGTLGFSNIQGQIDNSRYSGKVAVDVLNNTIQFDMKAPYIENPNVMKALSRKVTLPFDVLGTGEVEVQGSGPLQFNQLSYNFKLGSVRGRVANEFFDRLQFHVVSNKGNVQAQKIEFQKGQNLLSMTGTADPDGQLNLAITGNRLRLEQINNLQPLELNMTSFVNVTAFLRGYILDPTLQAKGTLVNTVVGERTVPDSIFDIGWAGRTVSVNANLMGETIITKIKYPLDPGLPMSIRATAKKFDITQIFTIISTAAFQKGFDTLMDGELQLDSPNGEFWTSQGSLRFDQFQIRRGGLDLTSKKPISMTLQNGILRIRDFSLSGDGGFVDLQSSQSSPDKLDMTLNSKVDLRLLALFMPFAENVAGQLSATAVVKGSPDKLEVLGSAYVQDGLLKLREFPHPFERVSADLIFSNKSIVANRLTARLGGGEIQAEGNMNFPGKGRYPLNIQGTIDRTTIDFPEGFRSLGSGTLYVRGDNVPYELGINYDVTSGAINRSINAADDGRTIKPSYYLPKFLVNENFTPFHLNMNVNTLKPIDVRVIVNNAEVRTAATAQLNIKGPFADLRYKGRATSIPPAQVTFRNNIFDLRNGVIEYNNAPVDNPNLFVTAETRVRNEYDINLVIQGPARKPQINLSSQPPLPDNEIVSLLALGVTSKDLDNKVGTETQTSMEIGSAFIRDQLGLNKNVERQLGVQLGIGTAFDEETNASVPVFSLSKEFTPKFGLSGSRTLGNRQVNRLKAEMKVNKNLSVIGQFENREKEEAQSKEQPETVGVDLEYKFEFK